MYEFQQASDKLVKLSIVNFRKELKIQYKHVCKGALLHGL